MAITKTKKYKKKRKKQNRQKSIEPKNTYNLKSYETYVFPGGKNGKI